jgi:hypothetical protein
VKSCRGDFLMSKPNVAADYAAKYRVQRVAHTPVPGFNRLHRGGAGGTHMLLD